MRFNEWINLKLFQPVSAEMDGKNQYSTKTQQMIRLCVITQFFPPDYAATGQLVEELVKNLGFLGIDIEVFTSQPGYAFKTANAPGVEQFGRVRIQRSRTAQLWIGRIRGKAVNGILYTFRSALHLFRVRNRNNILLVTTAPPFLPLLGYLARLLFRIPYICVLYDLYPDIAIALGVLPKHHWLAKFWQNLNCRIWRNASGIVVLSPAMRRQILMSCPEISDKVSVIHSWSDPDWIVPIAKQENWFAWKHNLVTKFTVLYSGNLGRCHDMDTILAAAKELRDEAIQFVCIGSGAKRDQLIQEVKELGLDNFMFLPYQDKHVLPYSLTACDLSLVTVDERTENLVTPSKLYSALASERPIAAICCQDSYLRELIQEADCGVAFENGDSSGLSQFIRLLSRDRQLAERMGKSGRQYLRSHFTPKIISKQYLDVLRRAISSEDTRTVSQSHTD
ncbi:glycosyltransferase family 4 protein [Calothrix sp. PCC 6303]|uniref:glycosyltransferase family 4 protein n=1 Tax=Calothrix sp. PCC 6303 TaxID=1170562 RepID=UPI0002A04550|nr:glycosyltransferase family 4 protein [Calothrix sp. PCC 6303]AFZ02028.1 glycosyl transferase group 1 [Calothrix sp. PCC 6303]